MSDYRLLMCIVKRDQGEAYIEFLREHGVLTVLSGLCRGTASRSMLDYLGLEKTEKVVLQTMVSHALAEKLLRRMVSRMGIDVPGSGIALTVPIQSVGGASSLRYLTRGQEAIDSEVKKVSEYPNELIMVIADKGNTDLVMDAARSAGARGGTVANAKGTGAEFTSKFFGVSIASEKEIVYIVAKRADRDGIMRAIMEQAGVRSDAHAFLFSLPVDRVVGLQSVASGDAEEKGGR